MRSRAHVRTISAKPKYFPLFKKALIALVALAVVTATAAFSFGIQVPSVGARLVI